MDFLLQTYAGKIVMTFLLSMVPVMELRGALPIGVASGLNIWVAIFVTVIGNLVPVPFIIIFIRKIFAWLRTKSNGLNRLVTKLEQKAAKNSAMVSKYEMFGLCLLVAIPLPGTGAWTGALVAAMLDMRLKKAFPTITLGVIIAAVIVAIITYGAGTLFSAFA